MLQEKAPQCGSIYSLLLQHSQCSAKLPMGAVNMPWHVALDKEPPCQCELLHANYRQACRCSKPGGACSQRRLCARIFQVPRKVTLSSRISQVRGTLVGVPLAATSLGRSCRLRHKTSRPIAPAASRGQGTSLHQKRLFLRVNSCFKPGVSCRKHALQYPHESPQETMLLQHVKHGM